MLGAYPLVSVNAVREVSSPNFVISETLKIVPTAAMYGTWLIVGADEMLWPINRCNSLSCTFGTKVVQSKGRLSV